MKTVVWIGNCQCSGLREVLKYTDFNTKYNSIQYANWQLIQHQDSLPIKDLESADVLIYQPLADVHGCFSTNPDNPNSMLHRCSPDTQIISFPRMHNNSLWPIFKKHQQKNQYYGGDFLTYYENQHICSRDQFLSLYDHGQMDFRMNERFIENMKIALKKEEHTTVKVHDFILSNLHTQRLFLTHDHPTTVLFHHCVTQIMDILDIDFQDSFTCHSLDQNATGLPDSVYSHPSCMYPDSSYTISYSDQTPNDAFYRTELIHYLDMNHIH